MSSLKTDEILVSRRFIREARMYAFATTTCALSLAMAFLASGGLFGLIATLVMVSSVVGSIHQMREASRLLRGDS